MRERLATPPPEPRRENIEAFRDSKNMLSMDEHLERGVTPTNNFKNWFLRDDVPERNEDGSPNPQSYKSQPWGSVMEKFRENNEVLWKTCKETAQLYQDAMERHVMSVAMKLPEVEQDKEFRDAAYWEMAGNLHQAFHAMLPELEYPEDPADYIDPLELCR